MFLRTYAKWIDGGQNALEMNRLEAAIATDLAPIYPKERLLMLNSLIQRTKVGWLMGLEPTTTGITILDSTN